MEKTLKVDENWKLLDDIEISPFRNFDEFMLGKARFEFPPFSDTAKWNNRVLSNLLYFQTNYILITFILLLISSVLNSRDMCVGLISIAVMLAALYFSLTSREYFAETRREHPYITFTGIVVSAFISVRSFWSILIVLFIFLIPAFFTFIHASIRLRNVKAKLNHQLEKIGIKKTLMARILDAIGVDIRS